MLTFTRVKFQNLCNCSSNVLKAKTQDLLFSKWNDKPYCLFESNIQWFIYIDGEIFFDQTPIFGFGRGIRDLLLAWSLINFLGKSRKVSSKKQFFFWKLSPFLERYNAPLSSNRSNGTYWLHKIFSLQALLTRTLQCWDCGRFKMLWWK